MKLERITTDREREQIVALRHLIAQRESEEAGIMQRNIARENATTADYKRRREAVIADFSREHAELVAKYKELREGLFASYENDGLTLSKEEGKHTQDWSKQRVEHATQTHRDIQQRSHDILEAVAKREARITESIAKQREEQEQRERELDAFVDEVKKLVRKRCEWPSDATPPATAPANLEYQVYLDRFAAACGRARDQFFVFQHLRAAKFLEDGWPLIIFVFGAILSAYPLWMVLTHWGIGGEGGMRVMCAGVAALMVAALIAIAVGRIVGKISRRQTLQALPQFLAEIAQARAESLAAQQAAQVVRERKLVEIYERRDKEFESYKANAKKASTEFFEQGEARVHQITTQIRERRRSLEEFYEQKIKEVEAVHPQKIRDFELAFERNMADLEKAYLDRRAEDFQQQHRDWQELRMKWAAGVSHFQNSIAAMNEFRDTHFRKWNEIDSKSWRPMKPNNTAEVAGNAAEQPPVNLSTVCIGQYDFKMSAIPGGIPQAPELAVSQTEFHLPVVLSYPEKPSLLLRAEGEGRDVATQVLQNTMLRLLTSFPPGKVRFTIIDPVGLGRNFSAFMHLADYDERLVNNRIWTESAHIAQRLTDLTEHMENVIQKYLRNEFPSILEYNQDAGEVAEPFQVLVIANFPANFSEESARRLMSIASSGARCGVYTLISTDEKQKFPRNIEIADLEANATTLLWDEQIKQFRWNDDDLREWPVTLEMPPNDEAFTEIVCAVGSRAKEDSKVEVPFASVTPPADQWWKYDSRETVDVPLGRAGAKKLQYMRLGKGTSQHVLMSGKTGSGKSTLLNALITNLAIHYSPDELQFYLIDFKKGVEFKAYASCRLPHARVIAIESEREFGLSVLERLDLELKNRGDLFRKHGVQDLKNYRNANPTAKMPRILLIIDEFQEFFTSDDKISHDSGGLLDRLVRQGRAFGIHVLLGSQTLAGAYTLARSTIGQMAVRIALQCSESDAHLILSEDNMAARLLNRPGEAIYNDANGLFEGNHPFQVVWLSDQQREQYLRKVAQMAADRNLSLATTIVFEGNVAADPRDNDLLRNALDQPTVNHSATAPRAWIGSAVAIKDPTEAVFQRQGGRNLLMVGQHDELARGILNTCLVSLAAQVKNSFGKMTAGDEVAESGAITSDGVEGLRTFYVLDGGRSESSEETSWRELREQLSLDMEIVTPREASVTITRLAEEVERRLNANEANAQPIFLFIDDLAKFRDLKKGDDFSLARFDDDAKPSADKQWATILREGPALGVHTIAWCDSFNNASRWIERSSMRDFEMRVLFQMSASDSSNLMDNPAASRLGAHMALFYSEEIGQSEKFRPYGAPSREWLEWLRAKFAPRMHPDRTRGDAASLQKN